MPLGGDGNGRACEGAENLRVRAVQRGSRRTAHTSLDRCFLPVTCGQRRADAGKRGLRGGQSARKEGLLVAGRIYALLNGSGGKTESVGKMHVVEQAEAGLAAHAVLPDGRKSGLMPPRNFVGKIVERSILFDRAAESGARLYAGVGWIGNGAEGVYRLKIPVTQVAEYVAVKSVRSRARDRPEGFLLHDAGLLSAVGQHRGLVVVAGPALVVAAALQLRLRP